MTELFDELPLAFQAELSLETYRTMIEKVCNKEEKEFYVLHADLAEEVWETFPTCLYSTEKGIYIAFMEISSKRGSQKALELPLDLTLCMHIYSLLLPVIMWML